MPFQLFFSYKHPQSHVGELNQTLCRQKKFESDLDLLFEQANCAGDVSEFSEFPVEPFAVKHSSWIIPIMLYDEALRPHF